MDLDLNRPEVVAEVTAAFAAYEQALVTADPDGIVGWFWDSPETVRYGIGDHQFGLDAQRAYRAARPPLPAGRTLHDTRVTTFGAHLAVTNTFFSYADSPAVRHRQSQTWVRLPEGWRIVSAHVSTPHKPA